MDEVALTGTNDGATERGGKDVQADLALHFLQNKSKIENSRVSFIKFVTIQTVQLIGWLGCIGGVTPLLQLIYHGGR